MPIYEYKCDRCDKCIEELQPLNAPPPPCPNDLQGVLGHQMQRQISVPSRAHFKGSGFYETDYKRRGE